MTGVRLMLVITMLIATVSAALVFATNDAAYVVRWTARTSLVLFALAYIARPAVSLWPNPTTKWLLRERKWLGDSFALSHVIHLGGIFALMIADWDTFLAGRNKTTWLAVFAYVVLFAMAITSIDRIRHAMSKRAWTALHRPGMHLFWIVFVGSYARRLSNGPIPIVGTVILLAIAGIRAAAWLRARSRARATGGVLASRRANDR
jgi:methionine sulfoxide reductase heme-binding subunit